MRRTCILYLITCTTSLAAQGEDLLKRAFERMDRDKDMQLSRKEYPGVDRDFRLMDRDKDKQVSFDEYKKSLVARRYLAAMRRNRDEARPRETWSELALRRLESQGRIKKIRRSAWPGPPEAFTSLDLDRNGVIDKNDLETASDRVKITPVEQRRLPRPRAKLGDPRRTLENLDKDGDGKLDAKELRRSPYLRYLDFADRNNDGALDSGELGRVRGIVNGVLNQRNRGYLKPRPEAIPFGTWDKDKDGRIDLKEWIERRYLFPILDRNRDAAVTPDEVLRYKRSFEGDGFLDKFDLNGDGKVTREEFGGTPAAFRRADRNGDGFITARDRG